MKKLLTLLMALMLLHLPAASLAENLDGLEGMIGEADLETDIGVIGGADGPTSIFLTADSKGLGEKALEAGRRIETELSIKELKGAETGDPTVDAAIKDLLEALAFAAYQQGDEGGLALQLSGQDVLTLGGAVSGENIYLSSNLLGGAVVVHVQEIEPLLGRFLDMFVLMEAMTAQEAAEIKEIMAEAFAGAEGAMAQSVDAAAMSMQELQNLDFTALEKVLAIVMENLELVEAPVVPKMCDAADGGFTMSISNAEFVEVMRAILDFVNANPVLKEFIAATGDFYTEAEIAEMWAWYQTTGLDETEEEFRARHQTFDAALAEAYEALGDAKLLEGEFTIGLYMNDAGELVYGVMNLPMYDGQQTEVLEIVYTRQTVAAGVAHVCNITVDGETVTIDALATEANTVMNLIAANGVKVLDVIITNVGEDQLKAELNAYEGSQNAEVNEKIMAILMEGEWEFTDVRNYLSGKLTVTNYDGAPQGERMTFTLRSDYAIDGVDFSGAANFAFDYEGVGMTLQVASATADAKESIMAGNVTRPAELDEAAFQTWFVGLVNNLSITLTTALTALPESVLMLVLSSGAM